MGSGVLRSHLIIGVFCAFASVVQASGIEDSYPNGFKLYSAPKADRFNYSSWSSSGELFLYNAGQGNKILRFSIKEEKMGKDARHASVSRGRVFPTGRRSRL